MFFTWCPRITIGKIINGNDTPFMREFHDPNLRRHHNIHSIHVNMSWKDIIVYYDGHDYEINQHNIYLTQLRD